MLEEEKYVFCTELWGNSAIFVACIPIKFKTT